MLLEEQVHIMKAMVKVLQEQDQETMARAETLLEILDFLEYQEQF